MVSLAGAWAGLARALKVFAVSGLECFWIWSTVLPPTRWDLKNNQSTRWVTIWNPGLSEQRTLLESKEPTQVWLGSCHRKDFGQKMRWGVINRSFQYFLFVYVIWIIIHFPSLYRFWFKPQRRILQLETSLNSSSPMMNQTLPWWLK